MHSQVDNVFSLLAACISTFIAFTFDVPAPAIFAAFIGSCFGVAFTNAVTYGRALCMLTGGTIAAGLIVSMVIKIGIFAHWLPDGPYDTPRGGAAILAFVLVKYNKELIDIFERRILGKGGTA